MIVVFSEDARRDIEEIHAYIAQTSVIRAYKVISAIRVATERLALFPTSGRPGAVTGTRELVLPRLPYFIPYYVEEDRVVIVNVIHMSRQWPDPAR